MNKLIVGSLCALGCEAIYGVSYMFTKTATESAGVLALLGWRFLIAVAVMGTCICAGIVKINLKGKSLKPLLLIALFSPFIYYICETIGISMTTASESGVFLACIPVASLIASTLILKERPSKLQVLGILITLCGVILTVVAVGAASSLSVIGYAALFAAVLSYALYSVYVEKAAEYTGVEITFIMLAVGAVVFGIMAVGDALIRGTMETLVMLPFAESGFTIAILYQGIGCSVCAFLLSNVAIAEIGVNRTSSFIGVSTVVSILAGGFILKESFSIMQVVGAVVILVGVYTANAKMGKEQV